MNGLEAKALKRRGIRATDLKHMLFAYPTHGSNLPYML